MSRFRLSLAAGVVAFLGLAGFFLMLPRLPKDLGPQQPAKHAAQRLEPQQPGITRINYEAIREGMTEQEVEAILGEQAGTWEGCGWLDLGIQKTWTDAHLSIVVRFDLGTGRALDKYIYAAH
jgi:hypothetical protein